jgi:peptide/nickel transport system permease protein
MRGLLKPAFGKVGVGILVAILLLIFVGSLVVPYSPYKTTGPANSAPTLAHPFGTDFLGKDILSQVVWGAYPTLITAMYASLGATLLGFFIGTLSGYFRKLEGILGGATDVILAFPSLPLLVLLTSMRPSWYSLASIFIMLVLWAVIARAVRAQTMSVKTLPYVDAAKTSGLNDLEIVYRIIMPATASIAVAYFIINLSLSIIIITALQFLGIGNPLQVSWGSILYFAQQYAFGENAWWWVLAPGLMISLVTTSFAFIGFAIETVLNPRLR